MAIPMGPLIDGCGPRRIALIGVLMMSGIFTVLGTTNRRPANSLLRWSLVAFAGMFLRATGRTTAESGYSVQRFDRC